ncbi:hypothetical protein [Parasitella parasitica]|uniref:BZIP domain-containing protein n=1 Tax=Parasitella parasitica TaxID=35722 RepID=A0A0B7NAZ9_9FUNG|nr:hypothetical protein [Parasitella parasitica]
MLSTQSTSVMSIGAITSPCSTKAEYSLPPLSSIADSAISQEQQTVSVGHWIQKNNAETDVSDHYPTHAMVRTTSSSSLSNRSRYHSMSLSSPSFSSSSAHSSDHEEEDLYHLHRQHQQPHQPYQRSRQNSLFSNFDTVFEGGRTRSFSNKSDALATRRARNKLASAKYRAKKQALTHAMQDRIMQLATQVMSLREELAITKKNEHEIKARYERLMQYHNNNSMDKNAVITRLY